MDEWFWMASGAAPVLAAWGLHRLWRRHWGAGSLRGYIHEDEEPDGKYRVLRKMNASGQRVALLDVDGDLWIYRNGELMFSTTDDENMYAESLVHIPMAAAQQRRRVLIIGGGGGITTREALRHSDVEAITTVDIDGMILDFGKNLQPLVRFNEGALLHPKVRTVLGDGRAFVENSREPWDVIIVDIPEPNGESPGLSRLFSREFYGLLKERLTPGGALSVACSCSSHMPEYFWSIQATLREAGFEVVPYHFDFIVDSGEDWGFCLATASPLSAKGLSIPVPTRHLTPERLTDMFHMPLYFARGQERGEIQTDGNRVLEKIVQKRLGR